MNSSPAGPIQQAPSEIGRRLQLRSQRVRLVLLAAFAGIILIGLVLLFLLMQANKNQELYESYYHGLLVLNILVACLLSASILFMLLRLLRRLWQKRFGSRLLFKLAIVFGLVGLLPGLLIYAVSYQFVARSIESWFDVKVEGALDAGVSLGRASLEALSNEAITKTANASALLADAADTIAALPLERLREQIGADHAMLWTNAGQLVASVGEEAIEDGSSNEGSSLFSLRMQGNRPSQTQLRQARAQNGTARIEGFETLSAGTQDVSKAVIDVLVLVQNSRVDLLAEPRFVQAIIPVPTALAANAVAVQEANREYQERALGRQGLQRMYIGTLTLTLFLAVFSAVVLAILFGNHIVSPLLVLAEGVREVAAGNLRPKIEMQGNDELDEMTRSFARMTQQLSDARTKVDASMRQLSTARANLQTILDNLTAGVIALDGKGIIQWINPGAVRILDLPTIPWTGHTLNELPDLDDFTNLVQIRFDAFAQNTANLHASGSQTCNWQQTLELPLGEDRHHMTSLVARGALMPDGTRLLVLDDITTIVSAQRAQAWGEVARRLAHEIKNPLTPIQLSAERLEMKLSGHIDASLQKVLEKSVHTIVEQVAAMKRLVNEFRDYARLPSANLQALDLNDLVSDVLHLYGEENTPVAIQAHLDTACPWILGDAQQLRQVIHNLLQNAQDATLSTAQAEGKTPIAVQIKTHWLPEVRRVCLTVEDHGAGFAEHILKRAFEPYVTTKPSGTGLGLAVVKKIVDEHGAHIDLLNRIENGVVKGAQVSVSFAVAPQTLHDLQSDGTKEADGAP